LQAAKDFQEALKQIPELRVIGEPDMCNVAFTGAMPGMNIYAINDLLTKKGWHLNALQRPAAVHMCFTAQHVDIVDQLIQVHRPRLIHALADCSSYRPQCQHSWFWNAALVTDADLCASVFRT
jgi:glutamate/tyrosine decarboxylase-like PLP-dependent enzyme